MRDRLFSSLGDGMMANKALRRALSALDWIAAVFLIAAMLVGIWAVAETAGWLVRGVIEFL